MEPDLTPLQLGPTIAAAENLPSEKIDYDVEGALKAGVDANDIVSYLAAETGYDEAGAKAAGLTNDDIIAHLTDTRQIGKTQATLEGISRGATVGAPALAGGYTGAMAGFRQAL
jgi:homoaconitase/3-isopropylmalate dehydratase large subunit